jgi:magnesium chelatase family protein
MELSVIQSRALSGIDAPAVRVETHLSNGLPAFNIVGMPETAVRESKDRVRCALLNSHFDFPDRRITVNLAPADLPKGGGRFDLPIALGILCASGQLPPDHLSRHEFLGELALDGSLRPVPGVVVAALAARENNKHLVVPVCCAGLAAHVPHSTIIPAPDLLTLCAHLNGAEPITAATAPETAGRSNYPDLREIVGQDCARRALEIAASGEHNLLLLGPPGTGKTLLASRLPGILAPPDPEDALIGLALHNFHNSTRSADYLQRPFRSPHHTATAAALVGGGSRPRPGEISLAHGGVLFLDELPEFNRHCLEVLREPIESGQITLSRASHKVCYPARFQLVAAMNPCPCGYWGDADRPCRCTPDQIKRYRSRISGPLLDRIDLHITVNRLPAGALLQANTVAEPSRTVQARVIHCREIQLQRQACSNARLPADQLLAICALGQAQLQYLEKASNSMHLSARALHRVLRVARTIADMATEPAVSTPHLSEALGYRGDDAGNAQSG